MTSLTAIDWSINMIEEAVTKDEADKVKFKQVDAELLPFKDCEFDCVVST